MGKNKAQSMAQSKGGGNLHLFNYLQSICICDEKSEENSKKIYFNSISSFRQKSISPEATK